MRKLLIMVLASGILLTLNSLTYADLNPSQVALSHEEVKALFLQKCNQTGPNLDQFCECFSSKMEKYIDDTALSKCSNSPNSRNCSSQVYENAMDQAKASVAQCENLLPDANGMPGGTGGMPAIPGNP